MFIVSTTFTGFQLNAHAQYLETHHEPHYFLSLVGFTMKFELKI